MAKKNKTANIDPSINLRLPSKLKQKIIQEAGFSNQTVSEYLRNLMSKYFNGDLYQEEFERYRNYWFVQSPEFLKLVVWIYRKKENNALEEEVEELNGYISTLKKLDEHLPQNLIIEFDRVLQDLIRVKSIESSYLTISFEFTGKYGGNKFDFSLLENYILSLNISI